MEILKNKNGNALTLTLKGRLETTTAPALEAVVINELGGVDSLTLDLSDLDYISSAGLRVLLRAQKTMNLQGAMVVTNVGETVREIFEITGFSDILTIE